MKYFIFLILLISTFSGYACEKWSKAKVKAYLDAEKLIEDSGLAVSRKYPGKWYHTNDNANDPYFYVSTEGHNLQKIKVKGFKSVDPEDLTIAKCADNFDCLVIADIGDNYTNRGILRDKIQLIFIKEVENFSKEVIPYKVLTLSYPDRPHNAEAFAFHPSGDFYLITKEYSQLLKNARPAQVFRLAKEDWTTAQETVVLEKRGEIDVPTMFLDLPYYEQIITAMDISEDGRHFLMLTYNKAVEVPLDIATLDSHGLTSTAYSVININPLHQQEAIAYLPSKNGKRKFIYDTEANDSEDEVDPTRKVPVMEVSCLSDS